MNTLSKNASLRDILNCGFVRDNLNDVFAVKTFGVLSAFPRITSAVSLRNFISHGQRANIVYGVNKTVELQNEGRFSLDKLYYGGRTVPMFIYRAHDDAPTAIICPGGAYTTCAIPIEGIPIAARLCERGCNAVVVGYGTGRYATPNYSMADLAAVIRYLSSCQGFGAPSLNNYAMFGFSAGGHLAGCFASKRGYKQFSLPRPSFVALGYPVVSFQTYTHKKSRARFLRRANTKTNRMRWSLNNIIDSDYPPVFIFHCKNDASVPVENSRLLYERLTASHIRCKYNEYEGGAHGCGLGINTVVDGWLDDAVEQWREILTQAENIFTANNR